MTYEKLGMNEFIHIGWVHLAGVKLQASLSMYISVVDNIDIVRIRGTDVRD